MNNAWIMVFVAGIIWALADGIVKIIRASKQSGGGKRMTARFDDLESDMASLEQELRDARQRIEVLEKIVTDGKYQLHQDIDNLSRETKRAG
jgi:predicted  nucleic acid-binding Zn-ribbon protein